MSSRAAPSCKLLTQTNAAAVKTAVWVCRCRRVQYAIARVVYHKHATGVISDTCTPCKNRERNGSQRPQTHLRFPRFWRERHAEQHQWDIVYISEMPWIINRELPYEPYLISFKIINARIWNRSFSLFSIFVTSKNCIIFLIIYFFVQHFVLMYIRVIYFSSFFVFPFSRQWYTRYG